MTTARACAVWLPIVVVAALATLSALSGRSPVDTAAAQNVDITGSAASSVYLDGTACNGGALTIGDVLPGVEGWKTAIDAGGTACDLTFGQLGSGNGATLTLQETPSATGAGQAAMRCAETACSGSSLADYSGTAEPSKGESAFGAQLLSASKGATAGAAGAPAVMPVADQPAVACTTAAPGDGVCSMTFGGVASVDNRSGSYQASVRYVALAR